MTCIFFFNCFLFLNLCLQVKHFIDHCYYHIISDLEFPVVELPPWGVVVSDVSLHPDTSMQQPFCVFRALGHQCLLLLLWQGGSDPTWNDDNLEKGSENFFYHLVFRGLFFIHSFHLYKNIRIG